MTFPPASMVTIGQYREAARAHQGSPARMIQPVEHPPGCRCREVADLAAARVAADQLWLLTRRY